MDKLILKMKTDFENQLKRFFAGIGDEFPSLNELPLLKKALSDFILSGGKRVRPLLMLLTYEGLGGKPHPAIYRMAIGIELFHAFALIHDDIVDGSTLRRGKPSLHEYLARSAGEKCGISGRDLALIAGDVVYTIAMEQCRKTDAEEEFHGALEEICGTAVKTAVGQFMEMIRCLHPEKLSVRDIFRIYELKTSYYTFVSPLSLGADAAGVNGEVKAFFLQAGLHLGKAYQIKDDLNDFPPEGKESPSDRATLPVVMIMQESGDEVRKEIKGILHGREITSEQKERLIQLFEDLNIRQKCEQHISDSFEKAKTHLEQTPLNEKHRNIILGIVGKILGR